MEDSHAVNNSDKVCKTENINWNVRCEDMLNSQINIEYWASYQYHLMWSYFDKDSVGLDNIAKFFKENSIEERTHAHKFMEYQNKRGGDVRLTTIPDVSLAYMLETRDGDVLSSFRKAIEMEQKVYDSLKVLHKVGDECGDPQFCDFIEGEYLEEQIDAMNSIKKLISQLERIGNNSHGIWHFNKDLV